MVTYLDVASEAEVELHGPVEAWLGAAPDGAGVWRDADGWRIEDLGLPETTLLGGETRRVYAVVAAEPPDELAGLRFGLEALKAMPTEPRVLVRSRPPLQCRRCGWGRWG